jgi:hypothetical protein
MKELISDTLSVAWYISFCVSKILRICGPVYLSKDREPANKPKSVKLLPVTKNTT